MIYSKGSTILVSKPLVHVISAKQRNFICEQCFQTLGDRPISCSICSLVHFCSQKCQNEEQFHRESGECDLLQQMGSLRFFIDDQVRLILRIILKLKISPMKDYFEEMPKESGINKRTFEDLMDHADEIKMDSQKLLLELYVQLSMILPNSDLPSTDLLTSIYGKIIVNAFSLKTERARVMESIGSGLFLAASTFDHSCEANAVAYFKGRTIRVRAIDDIDNFQAIRLNYVNAISDTKTRNSILQGIWYFTCQCELCQDIQKDALKHSLVCSSCKSPRAIDISEMRFFENSCPKCGLNAKVEGERLRMYKYIFGKLDNLLQDRGCQFKGNELEKNGVEDELSVIHKEMLGLFHEKDEIFIQSTNRLHQWHHHVKRNFKKSFYYGKIILDPLRYHTSNKGDVISLLLHWLGEAALHLNKPKEARKYLDEADERYRISLGSDHPFYLYDFRPLLKQLGK